MNKFYDTNINKEPDKNFISQGQSLKLDLDEIRSKFLQNNPNSDPGVKTVPEIIDNMKANGKWGYLLDHFKKRWKYGVIDEPVVKYPSMTLGDPQLYD